MVGSLHAAGTGEPHPPRPSRRGVLQAGASSDLRSSRYMRTVSKTWARSDGPADVALSSRRGRSQCRFPHARHPAQRRQPARKFFGNTCTGIGRASIHRDDNLLRSKPKSARQAGTITNNTVIHCRFYDLTHAMATLIYQLSKTWKANFFDMGIASGRLKSV